MSRHSPAPFAIFLIGGVLLSPTLLSRQVAAAEPTASVGANSELRAVKQVHDDFYAALNSMLQGDAEPFAKVWWHTDDVVYMGADGSYNVGWEQTYANWKKQAALKIGGEVKPSAVRFTVGNEIAMANQVVTGVNYFNGKAKNIKLRATSVFRKQDGVWKMICHHVDVIPPLDQTLKVAE